MTMDNITTIPDEVSMGTDPEEVFEHYQDIVENVYDEVAFETDHPAVKADYDNAEFFRELAGELAEDIYSLQEAGADNPVETASFWAGVAYGELEEGDAYAGGAAHNTVEQIPEMAEEGTGQEIVSIDEAMEGQDYFEEGCEEYNHVLQEIGVL